MSTKKIITIVSAAVVALAIVIAVAVLYFSRQNQYESVFYPGTTINGIDVSQKTPEEANNLLQENADAYVMNVIFKDETIQLPGKEIGYSLQDMTTTEFLMEQQHKVKYKIVQQADLAINIATVYTYNTEDVEKILSKCASLDKKKMKKAENAVLVYDEKTESFSLKDGKSGTELDKQEVVDAVCKAIDDNQREINIDEMKLYKEPVLKEGTETAQKVLDEANSYKEVKLSYLFDDGETEIIDIKTIAPWLYIDDNLAIQLDQNLVQELVTALSEKHASSRVRMDFKTTGGSSISLNVLVGAETLDETALYESIIDLIMKKESVETKAPYTESAMNTANNFGGNYVEVDLTNQKVYVYKDSVLKMSSSIVSGSVSQGHMTPTGVYKVYSMERNVTLRGADYASPVSYWMPFNGGVGFHDATWRSEFGGTIYQYDGSHGCINMPKNKAAELYDLINTGYYVVVYGGVTYVPGGSSGSSSSETEATTEKPSQTETKPATKPTETKPAETKPTETKPAETKPAETKPAETKPAETKPAETKPAETKPAETGSGDSGSGDSGSGDSGSGDSGSGDSGSSDSGSDDSNDN